MFCVHAEKADISFEGVYAVVCNELAKSLDPECDIVDREEDMGIAGLRRSKSSWQPLDIVDKYKASVGECLRRQPTRCRFLSCQVLFART